MLKAKGRKLNPSRSAKLRLPEKRSDAELKTQAYRQWREMVIVRAGYRCQQCGRMSTRLYADHIVERRDGGALLDPANGRALCGSCHTFKTTRTRGERYRGGVGRKS